MLNENASNEMEVPMFASGGFVKETGLIMPAPGSEAEIEPAAMTTQGVINYNFPVEVVVVGSLPEEERTVLEARIWERFSDALERMT